MTRVIVANLDAELEMARQRGGQHPKFPPHVRRLLAERAKTLGVLDPAAVVLPSVAGVVDDAAMAAAKPSAILAWAETESVRALRARHGAASLPAAGDLDASSWLERLWAPPPAPSVVRRCHDRRFWLELAAGRGDLLPETHVVTTLSALRAKLDTVTERSLERAWVAKAPLGASGRERVYRWEIDFPEDIEIRLERLLERYGELILEPLMKRTLDVGVAGVIDAGASEPFLLPTHRLLTGEGGVFRGVDTELDGLGDSHAEAITAATLDAARALRAANYHGPFGIDAFVYRDPAGTEVLHPMCEINARLTFGHLAWAGRARAAAPSL